MAVGLGVAMLALQIARTGAVPHHDGLLVLRELQQAARELLRLTLVTQNVAGLNGTAVEFGNADH
jgi:hypothetical protein